MINLEKHSDTIIISSLIISVIMGILGIIFFTPLSIIPIFAIIYTLYYIEAKQTSILSSYSFNLTDVFGSAAVATFIFSMISLIVFIISSLFYQEELVVDKITKDKIVFKNGKYSNLDIDMLRNLNEQIAILSNKKTSGYSIISIFTGFQSFFYDRIIFNQPKFQIKKLCFDLNKINKVIETAKNCSKNEKSL